MFGQIVIIKLRVVIFRSFINFLYAAFSGGTLLQSDVNLMSQQYNCLMELYTKFTHK